MPTKYVTLYIQARQADEQELRDIQIEIPVPCVGKPGKSPTDREIDNACDRLSTALTRLLTFDFHDHNPPDYD